MNLADNNIRFDCYANSKSYRKWIVSKVNYNFDSLGFHCVKKLEGTEFAIFGEPFTAFKHAKCILGKYKKQYSDAVVIIEERLLGDIYAE